MSRSSGLALVLVLLACGCYKDAPDPPELTGDASPPRGSGAKDGPMRRDGRISEADGPAPGGPGQEVPEPPPPPDGGGDCGSCTAPANADPTCTAGVCGWACRPGFHKEGESCAENNTPTCCGDACMACPQVGNGSFACTGKQCVLSCASGFHPENNSCAPNNNVDCCGAACEKCTGVAQGTAVCTPQMVCGFVCMPGFHPEGRACLPNEQASCCGAACRVCDGVANGMPLCLNGACDFACNRGFHKEGGLCEANVSTTCCGDECRACPAPSNGGAVCASGVCGTACNPGYHRVDSSTCAPNDTPDCCGYDCRRCEATRSNAMPACDGSSCREPSPCRPGYHECNGSCLSNNSVGSCGSSCSPCPSRPNMDAECEGGSCRYSCSSNYGNCDGDMDNGCEVDLRNDPHHCERCNRACPAGGSGDSAGTPICRNRRCEIRCNNPSFDDCDRKPENGCEVDLRFSLLNCGVCHPRAARGDCGAGDQCTMDANNPVSNANGGNACQGWQEVCCPSTTSGRPGECIQSSVCP
jgi:hypothetical protein